MKTDKLMNSSGQSAADIVVELLRLEPVTEASVEKNFGIGRRMITQRMTRKSRNV